MTHQAVCYVKMWMVCDWCKKETTPAIREDSVVSTIGFSFCASSSEDNPHELSGGWIEYIETYITFYPQAYADKRAYTFCCLDHYKRWKRREARLAKKRDAIPVG